MRRLFLTMADNNVISAGKARITSGFLLIFSVLYFFDGKLCLSALCAIFLHELGHAAALKLQGAEIRLLKFSVSGLTMSCSAGTLGYWGEIAAIAAGPAASFISAYLLSLFGERFYDAAGLSLIYGVFNLIPVSGLDGGGLVFAFTAMKGGVETAERVSKIIDIIILALMLPAGIYLLISTGRNFTLLFMALWLAFNSCKSRGGGIQYY